MTSNEAEEARRKERERILAMTPDERVELAFELGRQAVSEYMREHGVDRDQAVRALRIAGQAGRRRSVANEDYEPRDSENPEESRLTE